MAPKLRLIGTPQEFQRLGNIGALQNMSWAKIPTYYYDFNRFDLPLTAAEFTTEFGPNRPIFALGDVDDGTRQTNAAVGSGVNEVFLALGSGVIAMGEGEGFSLLGASVDRPAAAQNTPDVRSSAVNTQGGCYCGAADLRSIPAAQNGRMATLWWGAPTWRFIEKFFQAYRLQVIISNRFQIVDESLFDVGMTPVPPEFVGASDSNIPPMPFIRAVNDVMEAKAINNVFLPANHLIDAEDASVCIPPPQAPVTYGHPRIVGLANRIYCFSQPILFFPGMRFDVSFQNVEDAAVYTALQNSVTVNCTTADVNMNAALDNIAGCAQSCTIPGGSVSLGVVFKGFAMHPQACVEYLASYLVPGSMHTAMYSENQYLMGLLGKSGTLGEKVVGALGVPQDKDQ